MNSQQYRCSTHECCTAGELDFALQIAHTCQLSDTQSQLAEVQIRGAYLHARARARRAVRARACVRACVRMDQAETIGRIQRRNGTTTTAVRRRATPSFVRHGFEKPGPRRRRSGNPPAGRAGCVGSCWTRRRALGLCSCRDLLLDLQARSHLNLGGCKVRTSLRVPIARSLAASRNDTQVDT